MVKDVAPDLKVEREITQRLFLRPLPELTRKLTLDDRLEGLWPFITANYQKHELRLHNAARACGLSESYLNLILREIIGLAFHELLTRYRLFKALELMEKKNVSEAAFAVGFGSLSSFERNFRKILNARPKDFRRRLRSE